MKLKDGFLLRKFGDKFIVVALEETANEFGGLITLNQSGVLLWHMLEVGCEYDDLINALTEKYKVNKKIATRDTDRFLETARCAGLLIE